MPQISVIIPAYNQGQYLSAAVQSILDQTFSDFELLIVDDGSTDNTAEIAQAIQDPRIQYIYQENRGLSGARNTGVRQSTAPYVVFLDSDDLLLPDHLQTLSAFLDTNLHIGFVAGHTIPIDEAGNPMGGVSKPAPPELGDQFLFGNLLPVGSMMVRRSWLDKVGPFDESLRAYEDWDLWLRFVRAGCQMAWVAQPVFLYRFHNTQMTREGNRMRTATLAVLDKVFHYPEELPPHWPSLRNKAYSHAYLRAAAHAFLARRFADAQQELVEATRLNPDLMAEEGQPLAEQFSAWSQDPRIGDSLTFLEEIFSNLPEQMHLLQARRAEILGEFALQMAFLAYDNKEWQATRTYVKRSWRYHAGGIKNLGVWSIFIRSYLSFLRKSS